MQAFLLFCIGLVPFVLCYRAYPDPVLVSTQAAALLLIALLLFTALRAGGFRIGRVAVAFLVAGCLLALHGVLVGGDNTIMAAMPGLATMLGGLVIAMFNGLNSDQRRTLTRAFAFGLVAGGGVNIFSAWGQWLGVDFGPLFIRRDDLMVRGIYGNVGQVNIFVSYLFITYFAFLYLVVDSRHALRAGIAYGALVGLTVALTPSRAAALYMLVVLLQPGWASSSVRKVWFRSAIALLLFNLGGQGLIYHFGESLVGVARLVGEDSDRLVEYGKAISLFKENSLFGVGMHNYSLSSFEWSVHSLLPSDSGDAWTHPHNLFLMLLAGCGLLGVAVSAAILWVAISVLRVREKGSAWLFAAGALGCVFIHSQLEFPLWLFGYLTVFSVLLGIAVTEEGYTLKSFGRVLVSVAMVGGGLLSTHALYGYSVLVRNYAPVDGAEENKERIHSVYAVSVNPLISQSADLVVLNYLVPSAKNWRGGYCLFEKLARTVPSYTLLDNMAFFAWYAGEDELAQSIMLSRSIYYPKRDWGAINGMFQRYYPGQEKDWLRFVSLESSGFKGATPYYLTESRVCRR